MATKIAGTNSYTPMYINQMVRLAGQSRPNNQAMVKIKGKGGKACGCKGGAVKRKKGGATCGCRGSKIMASGVGIMYKKK